MYNSIINVKMSHILSRQMRAGECQAGGYGQADIGRVDTGRLVSGGRNRAGG